MAHGYSSGNRESVCLRCNSTVYQVDKIGPLKDFTFFHQNCFKCSVCGTKLTLRTYYNNQQSKDDKEVYCQSHVPRTGPGHLDGTSVGIKTSLKAPKQINIVNDQIRNPGKGTTDSDVIGVKSVLSYTRVHEYDSRHRHHSAGAIDVNALHIVHGINDTKVQKRYDVGQRICKLDEYLDVDTQKSLEMRHRAEEDALYRQFAKKKAEEEIHINHETQQEWEKELEKLTSRFQDERRTKMKNISTEEEKTLNLKQQKEKKNLEKNMTSKLDKRKESMTKKLLEQERAATADLVDKQSKEMINLINQKRVEFERRNNHYSKKERHVTEEMTSYPTRPPPPTPPKLSKFEIYSDPAVFAELDQVAINVAEDDQVTFTELVRLLISQCHTDVDKARVIFRWITVKNLNTMKFNDDIHADTPMALLRGIKHGTESYHVLFKRLCSYAGLHCVVIKGYSKSAGYKPGVLFEGTCFRNSWNAVYVAGAWRFVQCNWGARHLVNAKEVPKPGSKNNDSLRYEYDDHYFLTDPKEFIHDFYPLQKEWQLLRKPITLEAFEEIPFVRSLFFHYGLYMPDEETKAVLYTDGSGAITVRIGMPSHMSSSLIFHYNLKLFDNDVSAYKGVSLKRCVMQSVVDNIVSFQVHAPCGGKFLLDIFANAVTPQEYLTGEPMKFKSVCKFKIICEDLQTVMVPLPDCASGEWGPMKAIRLFGLIPITHDDALILSSRSLEIQFRMSRPLTDFMATLQKNEIEEKALSKYVSHARDGDLVTFFVTFPEEGQYGMDIYTREKTSRLEPSDKHLLTHCCKYLINYRS
ncbi:hillarin-like [Tachypleus tridentatus]|uniref:hillarin-like n=1 Tax=Tachypleus tridentatus TaxID=6853 RepID=UPI003FCFCDB3